MAISPKRRELRERGAELGREVSIVLAALNEALGGGKRADLVALSKIAPHVEALCARIDQFERDKMLLSK